MKEFNISIRCNNADELYHVLHQQATMLKDEIDYVNTMDVDQQVTTTWLHTSATLSRSE